MEEFKDFIEPIIFNSKEAAGGYKNIYNLKVVAGPKYFTADRRGIFTNDLMFFIRNPKYCQWLSLTTMKKNLKKDVYYKVLISRVDDNNKFKVEIATDERYAS